MIDNKNTSKVLNIDFKTVWRIRSVVGILLIAVNLIFAMLLFALW
jgi:hypothetical protein